MATATKEKKYELTDGDAPGIKNMLRKEVIDGEVVDQAVVARYEQATGVVEMKPDFASYRVYASKWLNENGFKFSQFGVIGLKLVPEGAPKMPKKNGRLGFKTPAVVEWYAKWNPKAFIALYQVTELQERIGWNETETEIRDEKTGQKIPHIIREPIYETVEGLKYNLDALKRGEPYYLNGKRLHAGDQRLIANCQTHLTTKLKDQGGSDEYEWDDE